MQRIVYVLIMEQHFFLQTQVTSKTLKSTRNNYLHRVVPPEDRDIQPAAGLIATNPTGELHILGQDCGTPHVDGT